MKNVAIITWGIQFTHWGGNIDIKEFDVSFPSFLIIWVFLPPIYCTEFLSLLVLSTRAFCELRPSGHKLPDGCWEDLAFHAKPSSCFSLVHHRAWEIPSPPQPFLFKCWTSFMIVLQVFIYRALKKYWLYSFLNFILKKKFYSAFIINLFNHICISLFQYPIFEVLWYF